MSLLQPQVSQTKDLARFHTPEVLRLQQELLRARESRNIAARQAWAELVSQVSTFGRGLLDNANNKEIANRILVTVCTLD